MIPRLYLTCRLVQGESAEAGANVAHYLRAVLRRQQGDPVILFNGCDGAHAASIAAMGKTTARFAVGAQLRPQRPDADIWLAFCVLKRDATDLVVQKATELGVSAILPVLSDRSNATAVRPERLRAITVEAAEQSERLTVPELHDPRPLARLVAEWPAGRSLAAALERTPGALPSRQGGLLIGPEGGFTPRELDALRSTAFIQPVSFGPRILRAETAAIAGLAFLTAGLPPE